MKKGREREGKTCRLCGGAPEEKVLTSGDARKHFCCAECGMINTEERYFLTREEEKKRYLLHENNPFDKAYRDFLMKAVSPALTYITREQEGLDYGAGPGPALSVILKEKGYKCADYDPFFFDVLPEKQVGFIFATEVIEHFFFPKEEVKKMRELLLPGGFLTLMTQRYSSLENFEKWYYARDDSHVAFYHKKTFDLICEKFGFKKLFDDGERVVILEKTS